MNLVRRISSRGGVTSPLMRENSPVAAVARKSLLLKGLNPRWSR
jgi:hypothetical protein